jgi:hypothetical protein
VRTDAFIRKRRLAREEVIAINHLLKSRARQYVAAASREWLYPEQSYSGTWEDIAKTLLPRDDLWQFGGEIYVGWRTGQRTIKMLSAGLPALTNTCGRSSARQN